VLLLACFQLAGFVHAGTQSDNRDAELRKITTELAATRVALLDDDATIASLRAGLERLGRQKHVTPAQVRRLERESAPSYRQPRPTATATLIRPGPTATITVTRSPRRDHHKPSSEPSPSCTSVQILNRCQPVPTPSVRLR